MSFSTIWPLLIAAIPVGAIASWLFGVIKTKIVPPIDGLAPWTQRFVFALLAVGIMGGLGALGVPVVCDVTKNCLASLDESTLRLAVGAFVTWLSGLVTHMVKKAA